MKPQRSCFLTTTSLKNSLPHDFVSFAPQGGDPCLIAVQTVAKIHD
jgi:hypothetical protein